MRILDNPREREAVAQSLRNSRRVSKVSPSYYDCRHPISEYDNYFRACYSCNIYRAFPYFSARLNIIMRRQTKGIISMLCKIVCTSKQVSLSEVGGRKSVVEL